MKKILYYSLLVLLLASCSHDKDLPLPVIDNVDISGSTIVGGTAGITVGETVVFTAGCANVEAARYEWYVNGILSCESAEFSFTPGESGVYAIKVKIYNHDGNYSEKDICEVSAVDPDGPYKNGMFFFGTTREDLSFYAPATGDFHDGNLFETVNGSAAGAGGINDITIHDNKLYILTPGLPAGYGKDPVGASVVICDAQTLELQSTVTADGFDMTTLNGEIYNIAVADENKLYIGYNSSMGGNISGIGVLRIDGGTATFTRDIAQTSGPLGVDGPCWSRMMRNGDHILAGCGSKLQVIDTGSDAVIHTIEIDPGRQVTDIVKGRDGRLYMIVAGEVDKSSLSWLWGAPYDTNSSVVAIDPADYSIISETEITGMEIKSGLSGCYATASLTSDDIFFAHNVDDWFMTTTVYRYNYTTGETSFFADVMGAPGLQVLLAGYMATDMNGLLYIPTTNWSFSTVGAFDIATGDQVGSITYRIEGDANVISTYQFAN